ncbi:hypothetical protein ACQP00_28660 [Dactylosporangium sp. CS-047395]|uniref:hypothetical protein n=1 Tax=Dactylosporangium sp. CS-047395 TaxID=3239936 RepID=UPI003D900E30
MSLVDPTEEFAAQLRELRAACGNPSVRKLEVALRDAGHPFPRSTISDKLAGVSRPSWEFVHAFVLTCARLTQPTGPAETVDVHDWRARHRRMLRRLAARRSEDRAAGAASSELADRPPRLEPVYHDTMRLLTADGPHAPVDRCVRVALVQGVRFVAHLAGVRPTMTIAELVAALGEEEFVRSVAAELD